MRSEKTASSRATRRGAKEATTDLSVQALGNLAMVRAQRPNVWRTAAAIAADIGLRSDGVQRLSRALVALRKASKIEQMTGSQPPLYRGLPPKPAELPRAHHGDEGPMRAAPQKHHDESWPVEGKTWMTR